MKRLLALVILSLMPSLIVAAAKYQTFSGEIMDSQCANMGSHDVMIKQEGAKDAKQCTLGCVKMGGKFVLFDAASKTVYQLDDQAKPAKFAGEKVTVKGKLDKDKKTIHVADIQPGS
jgi:uncharacterized protein DUF5818